MSGQMPPGWYPDPYGNPGLQRYWDGVQWSQATQSAYGPTVGPASPPRSSNALLWVVLGGGAVLVVIVLIVALVVVRATDEEERPTADAAPRSSVIGTLSDPQARLSVARLGPPWRSRSVSLGSSFNTRFGFTWEQGAIVHEDYDGTSDYYATIHTGRLPTTTFYTGTEDLRTAATSFARTLESAPEPDGIYPSHTRQDLESRSYRVDGNPAWYSRFVLSFPQAQSSGWNFRTETVVFILIDQGSSRPSTVWLSFPDSHANRGDLELLVSSLNIG
jgi:hypothetical protein